MKKVFISLMTCLALCLSGCGWGADAYTPLPHPEAVQVGSRADDNKATPSYESVAAPESAATPAHEPTAAPENDIPQTHEPTPESDIPQTSESVSTPDNQGSSHTEAQLIVSGKAITFDGQGAIIKDGEVFVPVIGVFEHLYGANENKDSPFTVNWDEGTATATIKNRWYTVIVTSEGQTFTCNGNQIAFTVPPQKIDGTLMLPLRAIAEAMDVSVVWDAATSTVNIFYESMISAY